MEETQAGQARWSDHIWEWRNNVMDRVLGLFPRETAEHLVNAQKEGVLALRSLLDKGLDVLEGDLKRVRQRPPQN